MFWHINYILGIFRYHAIMKTCKLQWKSSDIKIRQKYQFPSHPDEITKLQQPEYHPNITRIHSVYLQNKNQYHLNIHFTDLEFDLFIAWLQDWYIGYMRDARCQGAFGAIGTRTRNIQISTCNTQKYQQIPNQKMYILVIFAFT